MNGTATQFSTPRVFNRRLRLSAGILCPLALVLLTGASITPRATADEITLRGTRIPLPPVEVQRIDSGRVAFLDHRGRMTRTNVEEIRWIFFDGLPELQQAEHALDEGDLKRGLMLMLRANLDANEPMHRLWTHLRLSQVHEERGELIEAAGHLASVVHFDDDAAWTRFELFGRPLSTNIDAVAEARERIRRARAGTRNDLVRDMLDRMLEWVDRKYETIRKDDPEVRPELGATTSGYLIDALREGELRRPGERADLEQPQEKSVNEKRDERSGADPSDSPQADVEGAAHSNQRIAELLRREQWREAMELCERVADEPGDGRDMAEFLYNYGRVLRANEKPRDAAMMFMRSAIHYPDAHVAPLCLIEAAEIARDEFDNHPAARRMVDRAEAMLTDDHDPDARHRLRIINETLSESIQQP